MVGVANTKMNDLNQKLIHDFVKSLAAFITVLDCNQLSRGDIYEQVYSLVDKIQHSDEEELLDNPMDNLDHPLNAFAIPHREGPGRVLFKSLLEYWQYLAPKFNPVEIYGLIGSTIDRCMRLYYEFNPVVVEVDLSA